MALTPKQQRFVDEYLVDLNADQAARRAGYSSRTARFQASQNLTKRNIQEAIAQRRTQLAQTHDVTPERVIAELALIGFASMRDYAQWDQHGVTLTASTQLTPAQARVVGEVSQTVTLAGGTVRFKLYNKVAALDKLAKHLALYPTRIFIEILHKLKRVPQMADDELDQLIAEVEDYVRHAG
jgi:phage terminase small subunit